MNSPDRNRPGLVPWLLAGLCIGGIVHLAAIFLMPKVAEHDAYVKLGGGESAFTLLPSASLDHQSVPYQDPALEMAVCRFDVSKGPTRVRAHAPVEGLLSLSFYDRTGRSFYSMTDRAALRGNVDILLLAADELDALEANDPDDQAPQELRLVPPTVQGFILARAFVERPSARERADALLTNMSCAHEELAQE